MKKLALAAALVGFASTANAGNLAEPMVEPVVVVEDTAGSSAAGVIVPLMILALVGLAVAS